MLGRHELGVWFGLGPLLHFLLFWKRQFDASGFYNLIYSVCNLSDSGRDRLRLVFG